MKEIIKSLRKERQKIDGQLALINSSGKEHGSPDQTRGMLLESMFQQALGNIDIAIKQLEIIERELY